MKLPFEDAIRRRSTGLSLIEVIVSLAVFSIGMVAVYNAAAGTYSRQSNVSAKHSKTIMARAILEEYTLTYPTMERSGVYKNKWQWSVEESPYLSEGMDVPQDKLRLVQVSVKVWSADTEVPKPISLETVVTRNQRPGE
jgi:prepilin-type N-terminal cleavage/methylation domain-containing protein